MLNQNIFFLFNNLSNHYVIVDWFIIFLTNTFGYLLILLAFLYLIFYLDGTFDRRNFSYKYNFHERFQKIMFVFSSATIAWGLTTILKSIIGSPRPFIVFEDLVPLILHGGLDAFPSGHATFFGALAVSVYLINKKIGRYFIFGALLIGLSRIAAGVHWPIDILAGYIIGIWIPLIINSIFKVVKKPI